MSSNEVIFHEILNGPGRAVVNRAIDEGQGRSRYKHVYAHSKTAYADLYYSPKNPVCCKY